MKRYAINLIVNDNESYEKVVINKFPIVVICKTEYELKNILSSSSTIEYVKKYIKTEQIFNSAQWCVRSIYNNDNIYEIVWNVSDLINIEF